MIKQLSAPTVMIVEDDHLIAEDLAEVLKDLHYKVLFICDTGEEAIQKSSILKPDIILMDIRLRRKVDGIEAAKSIFEKERIPSVFLTAYADEETLRRVTDFGPFGYILKPYQERELKAAIDIALRRNQTEKKLEQSKFNFQDIVGKMQDGVLIFDSNSQVRFMNPAARLVLSDYVEDIIQDLMRNLVESSLVKEISITDLNKNDRIFEVKVVPYKWEGELVYLAAFRDITERQKAKQESELAERNIRRLIDRNADAIVVVSEEGNVLFANPSAQTMFNRSQKEFIGQHFGFPMSSGNETEIQVLQEGGDLIIAEMRTVKSDWRGEPCYLASIRDITEQKMLAEKFAQSQKMEVVGKLAGGVAHDFNNLLTVIKGYSELLMGRLTDDEKSCFFADGIISAANQAARLTGQLLAFSRHQVVAPKVFDLNALMTDVEDMLNRLIDEDVEMSTKLSKELCLIKMDPSQMEQIILNLVVNARDAMPNGGEIKLETKIISLNSDMKVGQHDIKAGDYVMLSSEDTGAGIPENLIDKIFDPFFTTKEKGKGTGLGLSTCYEAIDRAGGVMKVKSEVGKGTCFQVYIPLCKEERELLNSEKLESELPRGNETILLVEDEEPLRKMAALMLGDQGYTVLAVANGSEALEVMMESGVKCDLVLTDVVMPEMNGRELFEEIQVKHPEMKVLFMSGYTEDTIVKHGVLSNKLNFLKKPFGKNGLTFKVREVLDQKPRK